MICIISLIMLRLVQKKTRGEWTSSVRELICTGQNDARLSYTARYNINVYEKLTIRRLAVSTTGKINGYKTNVTESL